MSYWKAFTGGMYQALSPYLAADQAINVYPETRAVEGAPKQTWLLGTPGLALETTLATAGERGWFTQDGRTWVVYGDRLYERTAAATYVDRGEIPNNGEPCSFASNGIGGDQLGIVGGGALNVLDLNTNVLTTVTLPFSNPVTIVFQDGYGLINERDTPKFWFSALEDLTNFDALDFVTRSASSDNIVGLANTKDRVWALGTATTTQFYDSGDVDTPWLPYPGTTQQLGLVSPWALQVCNDTLYWVSKGPKTAARVVRATAAETGVISTPPIAAFFDACTTLADVRTLMYEQEGHAFFIVTAPSSPEPVKTYGFDVLESKWHARAGWDGTTGRFTRWRAQGCTVAGQDILAGDYLSGDVYVLDLATYADNGTPLIRERAAPYLGTDPQWVFFNQAQLLAQAGVGLTSGQGADPTVELLLSRDGAQTWISAGSARLGALGEYLARTIWRRLGRVRRDRLVIRVRQSDPVKCAWAGMDLEFANSTEQM